MISTLIILLSDPDSSTVTVSCRRGSQFLLYCRFSTPQIDHFYFFVRLLGKLCQE